MLPDQALTSATNNLIEDKRQNSLRVLMVEDDKDYYAFVRRLLIHQAQSNFHLVGVHSLAECSRQLAIETPDIIILDLNLPDSSGLPTLERVNNLSNGAPIIVLTGSDDEQIGVQAVALGAQDYLIKQEVSNSSLVRCVRYAIERRKSEEANLRMTAIHDFTNTLAHDLQVPLIGSAKVLDALFSGQFGELSTEQLKAVASLKESNRGQLHLVQKLLEIYKYESATARLNLEFLDVRQLVSKCKDDLAARSDKTAPIVTNLPGDLPMVLGDRNSLYRLFSSLLDNAIKFSTGSDSVEIRAERLDNKLAVHVHNFGPVIPPEVQNLLFQKFWKGIPGKRYIAHTGLGLYLCQRIAILHDGRITCRSTPEEGTTITVILPLALDE